MIKNRRITSLFRVSLLAGRLQGYKSIARFTVAEILFLTVFYNMLRLSASKKLSMKDVQNHLFLGYINKEFYWEDSLLA
jgi:hypothetical protein